MRERDEMILYTVQTAISRYIKSTAEGQSITLCAKPCQPSLLPLWCLPHHLFPQAWAIYGRGELSEPSAPCIEHRLLNGSIIPVHCSNRQGNHI